MAIVQVFLKQFHCNLGRMRNAAPIAMRALHFDVHKQDQEIG